MDFRSVSFVWNDEPSGAFNVPRSSFIVSTAYNRLPMSQMPKAPTLSVIVPCYNERATVAELLRRVKEVPIEKEIIVVDDSSTDGSRDVVAALSQQWPEIRHILQPVN